MNLTWAKKLKLRRHVESQDPFAKSRPLQALLHNAQQDNTAHAIRLENLRKGNFHTVRDYERQLSVVENRKRYQMLQTQQAEYDRLKSDHGLLGARAAQRMEELKTMLGIKDA